MTVKEMIEQLNKFDPDMNVLISDGYGMHFYSGDYTFEIFDDQVDIGIGGTEQD